MMLTLMLTSKGVAAVPRASLVILAGTLSSFNLPMAGIALILGVDTVMDMARTAGKVLGKCLASGVMARWGGGFGGQEPEAPATEERVGGASDHMVAPHRELEPAGKH